MKKLRFLLFCLALLASSIEGQAQRKSHSKRPAKKVEAPIVPVASGTDANVDAASANLPAKKNERLESATQNQSADTLNNQKKTNERASVKANAVVLMPFAYEFAQPQFVISRVVIEHDANGKGHITFQKQNLKEPITDPLEISAASLERIKNLWIALDFLNSTENYQSGKQFPHLGTMKLREQNGDRRRETEFNWTENKTANDLVNEYKKLTEQFTWIFDMNLARENQPLDAPALINRLDVMVNRNQISDARQMLPFLREIADDERLPLIARNRASKIVQRIEKQKP